MGGSCRCWSVQIAAQLQIRAKPWLISNRPGCRRDLGHVDFPYDRQFAAVGIRTTLKVPRVSHQFLGDPTYRSRISNLTFRPLYPVWREVARLVAPSLHRRSALKRSFSTQRTGNYTHSLTSTSTKSVVSTLDDTPTTPTSFQRLYSNFKATAPSLVTPLCDHHISFCLARLYEPPQPFRVRDELPERPSLFRWFHSISCKTLPPRKSVCQF